MVLFNPIFRRFLKERSASFATLAAMMLPVLLGLAGGVADLYLYELHNKELQSIADGAALAAVNESSLKGWSGDTASAVVDSYVAAHLARPNSSSAVHIAKTAVDVPNRRVTVTIEQDHFGYFVLGYFKHSPQIRTQSTAVASGSVNVCVIGLDTSAEATIGLNSNSVMTASGCAVYSNSKSVTGLESKGNSVLTAALACSAGGYSGATRNYAGTVLSDCPAAKDPLAGRPLPTIPKSCKYAKTHVVTDKVDTLSPGLYCGGLLIDGNADVKLKPGVYVFKDGGFTVNANSIVNGSGVTLVFTGGNDGIGFDFKSNVEVNIEAPAKGETAGILVYQDRDAPAAEFRIDSNKTRNLLGTLYLPNGHFVVNANNKVADQSAYTAIVARTIRLNASPNLFLNTDYNGTNVPVPEGLGPSGQKVRLEN